MSLGVPDRKLTGLWLLPQLLFSPPPGEAQPTTEMAAHALRLRRAAGSSLCPAWRQAHTVGKGHLKPEYDAVVIGAGNTDGLRGRQAP